MCAKITQNGIIIVPGDYAIVNLGLTIPRWRSLKWGLLGGINTNDILLINDGVWNARIESLKDKWMTKGYSHGTIEVDGFFERDKEFKFKKPRDIGVIYKQEHFLVITEPANMQIAKYHHRQPCFDNLDKLLRA